jgi:hypothetical protein
MFVTKQLIDRITTTCLEFEQAKIYADVAWGSSLPLLAAYTAMLTGDARFAARASVGASAYVQLLHSHANDGPGDLQGLLNTTNWWALTFDFYFYFLFFCSVLFLSVL